MLKQFLSLTRGTCSPGDRRETRLPVGIFDALRETLLHTKKEVCKVNIVVNILLEQLSELAAGGEEFQGLSRPLRDDFAHENKNTKLIST